MIQTPNYQLCSFCGMEMVERHQPAYSSQIGHTTYHYEKRSYMVCPRGCAARNARNKRWMIMGGFHLSIWIGLMIFFSSSYDMGLTLSNAIGVYVLTWFTAELINAQILDLW